jgi:hypothetical protein
VKEETIDGRLYLVASGTLMTEGVRKANSGPVLYSKEFIKSDVDSWDKIPIVYNHPKKGDDFISANSDGVIESSGIGFLRYPKVKGDGEAWQADHCFDVEKTKKVDQRIILALKTRTPFSTSTGLFLKRDQKSGKKGDKEYTSVAKSYTADHLAVLMDQKGACSIEDGCGVLVANEASLGRIQSAVSDAFYRTNNRGYVRDVYADFFVYTDDNGDLWRQSYSVDADGKVTIGDGKPSAVVWVTEYRMKDGGDFVGNCSCNNPTDKGTTVDKTQIIASLIANGQFGEADRPKLEALDADLLGKMAKPAPAPAVKPPAVIAPVTTNQQPARLTLNEFLAQAPPELQSALNQMVQTENAVKEGFIANILANPKNIIAAETLRTQHVDMLRGMSELATATRQAPVNSYGGMGGQAPVLIGNQQAAPVIKPLVPPAVIVAPRPAN